jgi:hypothetical protein
MNTYKSCSCRYPDLTYNGLCKKCKKVCIQVTDVVRTVSQNIYDVPILRDYYDFSTWDYVSIEREIERSLWKQMEEEGFPKLPMSECLVFYKEKAETVTLAILRKVLFHMAEQEYADITGAKRPLKFWIFPDYSSYFKHLHENEIIGYHV